MEEKKEIIYDEKNIFHIVRTIMYYSVRILYNSLPTPFIMTLVTKRLELDFYLQDSFFVDSLEQLMAYNFYIRKRRLGIKKFFHSYDEVKQYFKSIDYISGCKLIDNGKKDFILNNLPHNKDILSRMWLMQDSHVSSFPVKSLCKFFELIVSYQKNFHYIVPFKFSGWPSQEIADEFYYLIKLNREMNHAQYK